MEPVSLNDIASHDWANFSPEAKKNSQFLHFIFAMAKHNRYNLAQFLETPAAKELDDHTIFLMKAIYHVMNQWSIQLPKLIEEAM